MRAGTRALIDKAGGQLIRRRFAAAADLRGDLYASLIEHLERTKPFDAAACPDATLADLSEDKLRWFLGVALRGRQYPLREETASAAALEHLNLLTPADPATRLCCSSDSNRSASGHRPS